MAEASITVIIVVIVVEVVVVVVVVVVAVEKPSFGIRLSRQTSRQACSQNRRL